MANILFLIMSVFIMLWISSGYLSNINQSLWVIKINVALVPPLIVFIYSFYSYFIKRVAHLFVDIPVVVSGIALSGITLFTDQVVQKFDDYGGIAETTMASVYYIWVGLMILLTLTILIRKYVAAEEEQKKPILSLVVGTSIFAFGNIVFNIIVPIIYNSDSYWNSIYYRFGDYSVIFLLSLTAYAIVKHHLFDIKVIATETIVIALSLALFVQIFLSNTLTESLLKGLVWALATYGGWRLVKSVKHEIAQKEKIEKLAFGLEEANKKLEELDKVKDDFLSMASHELNTPISAIEGYLSMIIDEKMGGELNETHLKYLTSVYTSSQRLAALVRDLLNVSRIESGRIHIIYSEAQMEDVIEQSVMEVKSKVDQAKHTLTVNKPTTPTSKTWFDVPRITEVIINLIGNSIKYTDEGGKIEVGVKSDDQNITVWIKDNGRGIPKERQAELFQKFTQADIMKDEAKGTGLGLYISKNFIELQKGKIWFESEGENKGTTFYFSLPILKEKPVDEHEGEGAVVQMKSTKGGSEGTPAPEQSSVRGVVPGSQGTGNKDRGAVQTEAKEPKDQETEAQKEEKDDQSTSKS